MTPTVGANRGRAWARGIRLAADMVPNHMGIAEARNPWWRDVLANGAEAYYTYESGDSIRSTLPDGRVLVAGEARGAALAQEVGGTFLATDVTDESAVAAAVDARCVGLEAQAEILARFWK